MTIADAVLLQKYLIQDAELTAEQLSVADVCEDGAVNGFDLSVLKRKLLQNNDTENRIQETIQNRIPTLRCMQTSERVQQKNSLHRTVGRMAPALTAFGEEAMPPSGSSAESDH